VRAPMADPKSLLSAVLDYVSHLGQLTERIVSSVRSYGMLMYLEHELRDKVGVHHDVIDQDGSPVWIKIERLLRRDPPQPGESIRKWLTVTRDPSKPPQVQEQLIQAMPREQADGLVKQGKVDPSDVMGSPRGLATIADVRLRLDRLPEVRRSIDEYIEGPWRRWSEEEKPRRETIAIYEKLFGIAQTVEAAGAETPVEVVFGVGMALWRTENKTIEHPLIEALVELDIEPTSHAIHLRPREKDPWICLKPFEDLPHRDIDNALRVVRAFATKRFDSRLRQSGENTQTEPPELSPFNSSTFEDVLRFAAGRLGAGGQYYPDHAQDRTDRSLPALGDHLTVTDTWAVYARPRSGNFYVQDVERLKGQLDRTSLDAIPSVAKRWVTVPSDQPSEDTRVDLTKGIGHGPSTPGALPGPHALPEYEVLFPKAYNEAQIEIVQQLETADGMVVQGPPGTGKTHTIANIICHYLATGRNVLVVSKGEPALEVLREHIPEGIRNLAISLLTSEREGFRQLDSTVRAIDDALGMRRGQIQRDRVDREQEVQTLRREISGIDGQIKEWAREQLTPVAEAIFPGKLRPSDLAQLVGENRKVFEWLPDQLGPGQEYDCQFSPEDITAIRGARVRLGANLDYLGCLLPSPNDLPDAAAVGELHERLVRAARIRESAITDGMVLAADTSEATASRAEALGSELRRLLEVVDLVNRMPWLETVFDIWSEAGVNSGKAEPYNALTPEMERLNEARNRFLVRPVQTPPLGAHRGTVRDAVGRAARGLRPFPPFSFPGQEVKRLFAQIRIAGKSPTASSEWAYVRAYLRYEDDLMAYVSRWNNVAEELSLPRFSVAATEAARQLTEWYRGMEAALSVAKCLADTKTAVKALLPDVEVSPAGKWSRPEIESALRTVETNRTIATLRAARTRLDTVLERLQPCAGRIIETLRRFLQESVGNGLASRQEVLAAWQDHMKELIRARGLGTDLDTVDRVAALVARSGAPLWAQQLRTAPASGSSDPWTPDSWVQAWRFRRLESYLRQIDRRERLKAVAQRRDELEQRLRRAMADVVRLRSYLGLHQRMTAKRRSALRKFIHSLEQIGAGTGIRARRYRSDAREAMEDCIPAVPCWIMPTWRVSETLPAELGMFDLLIVDEASQSDAMTLPALLRAKKTLVVGDDKQVSPALVGIEERRLLQLRDSYLRDQPFASALMPGSSLYDLAKQVFPGAVTMLTEHFRCAEPIIHFSSREFYDGRIVPLRIPKTSERLDPPLVDVYLPGGCRNGQKINEVEATAIVDEIRRLVEDPGYDKRSIGVVSLLGKGQSLYIQKLLLEQIGGDRFLQHRITCGDAATFQGKERDIMFVSMVASPGFAHAQTTRLFRQRFNVALSRARDRMYVFRSVNAEDLRNAEDLKLKVIEHLQNPMPRLPADVAELADLCESNFEREVFRRLVAMEYRVTPQVPVGPYRIDLVIEGEADRRLAVELDGDRHHGPERWLEDWRRQTTLERMGWTFWRCWASSWSLDREACLCDLVTRLDELRIRPIGGATGRNEYTEHRVVQGETRSIGESGREGPHGDGVEIGDRIILAFDDDPNRQYVLRLSETEHDPLNGVIRVTDAAGEVLLHAAVEDEVDLPWNGKLRRATILGLEKLAPEATEPTATPPPTPTTKDAPSSTTPVPQQVAPPAAVDKPLPPKVPMSAPASSGIASRPPTTVSKPANAVVSVQERKAVDKALGEAGKRFLMWQLAKRSAIREPRMEEILPVLVREGFVKRFEDHDGVRYSRA
jgi:very-short-patch-repair endonuclease